MSTLIRNLDDIQTRIRLAASKSGREARDITLVAVTKNVPVERIQEAIALGITHFGENRVQEAAAKIHDLAYESRGCCWHMIGHLQSNKVNKAAELFARVDSVDRWEIVQALHRRLENTDKVMDALVEVKLSGEPNKSGVGEQALFSLLEQCKQARHLRVRGLMTMAALVVDTGQTRAVFSRLRKIFEEVNAKGIGAGPLEMLSMGMSGDFEIAIEEGATEIRLGQALFGERKTA